MGELGGSVGELAGAGLSAVVAAGDSSAVESPPGDSSGTGVELSTGGCSA
ncbi:hypothetical protein U9R90_10575 [Streptomyces sp. E11-3]